jgi:hypothetical protein
MLLVRKLAPEEMAMSEPMQSSLQGKEMNVDEMAIMSSCLMALEL